MSCLAAASGCFSRLPHHPRPFRRNTNLRIPRSVAEPAAGKDDSRMKFVAGLDTKPIPKDDGDDTETCETFYDRDGNIIPVMCCDYGFRSGSGRMYQEDYGRIPTSGIQLALENFGEELQGLRRSFRFNEYATISEVNPPRGILGSVGYGIGSAAVTALSGLDKTLEESKVLTELKPSPVPETVKAPDGQLMESCKDIRSKLKLLKLSNEAVWDRERKREAAGGAVETPWFVKVVYYSLCWFLDVMFDNRPIQRFWFLETVARMPYFSYISMLHLYESLGWWRAGAELRKIHFAEEWNELHHLQIMESLGGDQLWVDRFVAQHAAIVYYWILLGLFFVAPKLAYNFSELIEAHAVDTYGEFADVNKDLLRTLPAPLVAVAYYRSPDLYLFDEFQTSSTVSPRTPQCNNLYDVFINIRDDEGEHVKTMAACQDQSIIKDIQMRRDEERRI